MGPASGIVIAVSPIYSNESFGNSSRSIPSCAQIDQFKHGLMNAVLDRDQHGNLIRKAGIMNIVLESGEVHPGDQVRVQLPPFPHTPLERV